MVVSLSHCSQLANKAADSEWFLPNACNPREDFQPPGLVREACGIWTLGTAWQQLQVDRLLRERSKNYIQAALQPLPAQS